MSPENEGGTSFFKFKKEQKPRAAAAPAPAPRSSGARLPPRATPDWVRAADAPRTSGRRGWKGPYLGHESATADPWGTKYYANVEFLQPANVSGAKPVFVLSAGPNKLIETAFSQTGPSLAVGGDNITFRVK